MSYLSQRSGCKAKVEGWKLVGPKGHSCVLFLLQERGVCFYPEGKKPVEGDGI